MDWLRCLLVVPEYAPTRCELVQATVSDPHIFLAGELLGDLDDLGVRQDGQKRQGVVDGRPVRARSDLITHKLS